MSACAFVSTSSGLRFKEQGSDPFRHSNHAFRIEVGCGDMKRAVHLLDDGTDDIRMRVPRGGDGEACGAIQKPVAVYVFNDRTCPPRGDERIWAGV